MIERRFSSWFPWTERKQLPKSGCPGVYAIARSRVPLAAEVFKVREDIIYFGMTNAIGGLQSRLQAFDNTISGKRLSHGGADRVRQGYPSYARLRPLLYVSIARFSCNPSSNEPRDLRKMGEVARFEYLCFAEYAERFGSVPRFNDKVNAAKFSKRVDT